MRLVAWSAVAHNVADDPLRLLFGHGVEGARLLGERLGEVVIFGVEDRTLAVPTHPHNVFLQILYDLGLVGLAAIAFAAHLGGRALRRAQLPRDIAAAVAGLAAATLVFAMVDASLWTLWRVAGPILGAWGLWLLYLTAVPVFRPGGVAH
jgi:O-antigen ligase